MDEFENFETKAFVGRLLGKGDWTGFMDKIKVCCGGMITMCILIAQK